VDQEKLTTDLRAKISSYVPPSVSWGWQIIIKWLY
jgi:hypothetical protein